MPPVAVRGPGGAPVGELSQAAYWELLGAAERYVELLDATAGGFLPRALHAPVDELWWTEGLVHQRRAAKLCVTNAAVVVAVDGGAPVTAALSRIEAVEVVATTTVRLGLPGRDLEVEAGSAAVAESIRANIVLRQGPVAAAPLRRGTALDTSAEHIFAELSRLTGDAEDGDFDAPADLRHPVLPLLTPPPTGATSFSISCDSASHAAPAAAHSPAASSGTLCVVVEDGARVSRSRSCSPRLAEALGGRTPWGTRTPSTSTSPEPERPPRRRDIRALKHASKSRSCDRETPEATVVGVGAPPTPSPDAASAPPPPRSRSPPTPLPQHIVMEEARRSQLVAPSPSPSPAARSHPTTTAPSTVASAPAAEAPHAPTPDRAFQQPDFEAQSTHATPHAAPAMNRLGDAAEMVVDVSAAPVAADVGVGEAHTAFIPFTPALPASLTRTAPALIQQDTGAMAALPVTSLASSAAAAPREAPAGMRARSRSAPQPESPAKQPRAPLTDLEVNTPEAAASPACAAAPAPTAAYETIVLRPGPPCSAPAAPTAPSTALVVSSAAVTPPPVVPEASPTPDRVRSASRSASQPAPVQEAIGPAIAGSTPPVTVLRGFLPAGDAKSADTAAPPADPPQPPRRRPPSSLASDDVEIIALSCLSAIHLPDDGPEAEAEAETEATAVGAAASSREGFSCLSPPSPTSASGSAVLTPHMTTVEGLLGGAQTPAGAMPVLHGTPSDGTYLNDESCAALPTFLHATVAVSPECAVPSPAGSGDGPERAPTIPPSQSAVMHTRLPPPQSPEEERVVTAAVSSAALSSLPPSQPSAAPPVSVASSTWSGHQGVLLSPPSGPALRSATENSWMGVGEQGRPRQPSGSHEGLALPPPRPHASSPPRSRSASVATATSVCSKGREDRGSTRREALYAERRSPSACTPTDSALEARASVRREGSLSASAPVSRRDAAPSASTSISGREDRASARRAVSSLVDSPASPPIIPLTRNIGTITHLEGVALGVAVAGEEARIAVLARGDETTVVPVGAGVARMFQADAAPTLNSTAGTDPSLRAPPPEVEVIHALSAASPVVPRLGTPVLGLDPRPNGARVQHLSLFCEFDPAAGGAPPRLELAWRCSAPCGAAVEVNFHPGLAGGAVGFTPAPQVVQTAESKFAVQLRPEETVSLGTATLARRSDPALIRGGRRYEFLCRAKVTFRPLAPAAQVEYLRVHAGAVPEAAHVVLRRLAEEYGFTAGALEWYLQARLEGDLRHTHRGGAARREHVDADYVRAMLHEIKVLAAPSASSAVVLQRPQHYLPIHRSPAVVVAEAPDARVAGGRLAHRWWVVAARALASRPALIQQCFREYDLAAGHYVATLCTAGWWTDTTLDTWLPTLLPMDDRGAPPVPAFAHTPSGELWAPMLEKACARSVGGYDMLRAGGTVADALAWFTGAATARLHIATTAPEALWEALRTCVEDGGVAAVYSAGIDDGAHAPPASATVLEARDGADGRVVLVRSVVRVVDCVADGEAARRWYAPREKPAPRTESVEEVGEYWLGFDALQRAFEWAAVCRARQGWRDVRVHATIPPSGPRLVAEWDTHGLRAPRRVSLQVLPATLEGDHAPRLGVVVLEKGPQAAWPTPVEIAAAPEERGAATVEFVARPDTVYIIAPCRADAVASHAATEVILALAAEPEHGSPGSHATAGRCLGLREAGASHQLNDCVWAPVSRAAGACVAALAGDGELLRARWRGGAAVACGVLVENASSSRSYAFSAAGETYTLPAGAARMVHLPQGMGVDEWVAEARGAARRVDPASAPPPPPPPAYLPPNALPLREHGVQLDRDTAVRSLSTVRL